MFKKNFIVSISVFFVLMIFTSVVKNSSRNIEKNIENLNREISLLEKQLHEAEIDYVYLSNPENLNKHLINFKEKKYIAYDHSRIFLTIDDFLKYSSKQTKKITKN
tara:strand:- start:134 stop:451 length:318 start_codon:yes stop_codon:yes gene_type:complete